MINLGTVKKLDISTQWQFDEFIMALESATIEDVIHADIRYNRAASYVLSKKVYSEVGELRIRAIGNSTPVIVMREGATFTFNRANKVEIDGFNIVNETPSVHLFTFTNDKVNSPSPTRYIDIRKTYVGTVRDAQIFTFQNVANTVTLDNVIVEHEGNGSGRTIIASNTDLIRVFDSTVTGGETFVEVRDTKTRIINSGIKSVNTPFKVLAGEHLVAELSIRGTIVECEGIDTPVIHALTDAQIDIDNATINCAHSSGCLIMVPETCSPKLNMNNSTINVPVLTPIAKSADIRIDSSTIRCVDTSVITPMIHVNDGSVVISDTRITGMNLFSITAKDVLITCSELIAYNIMGIINASNVAAVTANNRIEFIMPATGVNKLEINADNGLIVYNAFKCNPSMPDPLVFSGAGISVNANTLNGKEYIVNA